MNSSIHRPHSLCKCQITKHSLVSIVILSTLFTSAYSYTIIIDAGAENECFHERVPIGTKLGFAFEVIEGGFYDIDVDIKDPNNVILHSDERTSNGKFTIEANLDGPYYFCFHNKKSSYTPKTIAFDIDKTDALKKGAETGEAGKQDDEVSRVVEMTQSLLLATISSRHDVRYLLARDKIHRKVNEATNSTIVWWSAVEFILLLFVSLGQVWYLRRFFEIRRKA